MMELHLNEEKCAGKTVVKIAEAAAQVKLQLKEEKTAGKMPAFRVWFSLVPTIHFTRTGASPRTGISGCWCS